MKGLSHASVSVLRYVLHAWQLQEVESCPKEASVCTQCGWAQNPGSFLAAGSCIGPKSLLFPFLAGGKGARLHPSGPDLSCLPGPVAPVPFSESH